MEVKQQALSSSHQPDDCKPKAFVYFFQKTLSFSGISNSYTMGCPPVHGDNPRALAIGLSYVQVDKHVITILYHQHLCRPCTSRDISC